MAAVTLLIPLIIVLGCAHSAHGQTTETRAPLQTAFESDQIRVHDLTLAPGERTEIRDHRDALLIPFGTDLDGRLPAAEAGWRAAGTTTLENRGSGRFSGVLVELTAPASDVPASLPPEVAAARVPDYRPIPRVEGHRVITVIDDARALVTRHRLPAWQRRTEPLHGHPREVVVVYLAGGEIRGSTGRLGARRVRRGDFDVLPAHVWHAFQNVGNDPIEFLMISPK